MKPQFEAPRAKDGSTSFSAYRRTDRRFDFHWHFHPEFELTYIEQSQGERLVGDQIESYRSGDLVLLGPNLPHAWTSRGPGQGGLHRAVVVQFGLDAMPPQLRGMPEFSVIDDLLRRAGRGLHFEGAISTATAKRLRQLLSREGLGAWLLLLSILARLAEDPRARALASVRFVPDASEKRQSQLQGALDYIERHNDPELSLDATARAAHVSSSTLSRLFRRSLGRSFGSYVTEFRIGLVARDLIESERGVAEIAYAAGYNNLANFNRRFQRMKRMSPREFRMHYDAARSDKPRVKKA